MGCYYKKMIRKMKHMIDWFVRGKDGHVHLVQFPNIPIIGWFASRIVSDFIATGPMKTGFSNVSLAFLAVWSYLEIVHGLSYFRRMLGVIVAILIVYSFFA
jgi:hypothetical protein